MFQVILKDDSAVTYSEPTPLYMIAKNISEELGRTSLAAEVNGKVCEMGTVIDTDSHITFLTFEDQKGKDVLRHTASHVLAQAVKRLYPQAKLAIGPAIANGFYYDFDCDVSFTPEILKELEKEMKKIVKENYLKHIIIMSNMKMKNVKNVVC